ncbi:MAG: argininosuccinate synthase [Bacteroidales bacterium]|jgi:argininosuccinate synthase|nr:argininosuccinate synthase [Bacteroidales bacterium]MCI2121783.1 argininosuccinate synthase [Bacteroidales bacterium]MCI2146014.1 argininosuccinate synthase [Bacteroidales bacterium]
METNAVVLAFSGGLDTSFCVPYLKNERNLEVHTVTVNTGGFSPEEVKAIEERALKLGAKSHVTIDAAETYYQKGIKYLIYGNVLKNDTYPLSVSSERIFQAIEVLKYAKKIGAGNVAHGSTGAGNDQVRFDIVFDILAPEMKIIAPVRELASTRIEEINYLKEHGFNFDWKKSKYSINQGLWGTSVGGQETLDSAGYLPEEAYPSQAVKKGSEVVSIGFEHGEPVSLNGVREKPVELIRKLNTIAAPYGIGRDIHVGDTIIGIKGRVAFEAAAPLIIIKAHHLLEKHVLTQGQLYWKGELAGWYGKLMHEAQYLDPVMRNIEKFFDDAEKTVTGTVNVELKPYSFFTQGIKSDYDMMKAGEYGEKSSFLSGADIVGFTKVLANPMRIYYSLNKDAGKEATEL